MTTTLVDADGSPFCRPKLRVIRTNKIVVDPSSIPAQARIDA